VICRCCDTPLKPEEIIWIPDRHTHEDMCRVCRKAVQDALLYSDLAGPNTSLNYLDEPEEVERMDESDTEDY